jgi:hypothetical protein
MLKSAHYFPHISPSLGPMYVTQLYLFSGLRPSPLGTMVTTSLLYQHQMIMVIVEQLVEWRWAGETVVLGEKKPHRHFVPLKSHMTRPELEPRLPWWEASD